MHRLALGCLLLSTTLTANAEEITGDYVGRVAKFEIKANVAAAGGGEFELKVFPPGGRGAPRTAKGRTAGGVTTFRMGTRIAKLEKGVLTLFEAGEAMARLKRVGGAPAGKPKPQPLVPNGDGFRSTVVPVDATKLVRKLAWSADAKSLFVLEADGLLRKLDLPNFRESKRIELAGKCSDLSVSALGPVVLLRGTQHVVLLDEDLVELQRQQVPGVISLTTAPTLEHAFLVGDRVIGVWALKKKGRINVIPVTQFARTALRVKRTTPQPAQIDFRLATCTPDGKYLLTAPDHRITRFRIRRGGLILEEQGWRIGHGGTPTAMCVGGDPGRVSLVFGGGNEQPPGHPEVGYGSYVYDVTNLRLPVTTIEPGAYPRAVGFDTAAGLVYGQESNHELVVFNEGGAKLGEFDLGKNANQSYDRTQVLLPHPEGGRTLVLTERQLYWCTLPKAWVKKREAS